MFLSAVAVCALIVAVIEVSEQLGKQEVFQRVDFYFITPKN